MSEQTQTEAQGGPIASAQQPQQQQSAAPQQAADWRSIIPESFRSDKGFEKYKDADSFFKGHLELASKVGMQSLPVPQDGWTDAQWGDFFNKLGRPEKPDDYKLERPQLPEGQKWDDDLEKWFKEKAHSAGLSQKMADKLFREYTQFSTERLSKLESAEKQQKETEESRIQQGISALQKEWGDQWTAKVDGANLAVKHLGGDELAKFLNESGVGNEPVMIKFFAKLGETLSEDSFRGGSTFRAASAGFKSPSEALSEIGHLKTQESFMKTLMNKNEVGHAEAAARWKALHEAAYPEKK